MAESRGEASSRVEDSTLQDRHAYWRANLRLDAVYRLISASDQQVIYRGSSFSVNSYNILDLQVFYATTVAEQDAIKRGLREISDDIELRLATYFARDRPAGQS